MGWYVPTNTIIMILTYLHCTKFNKPMIQDQSYVNFLCTYAILVIKLRPLLQNERSFIIHFFKNLFGVPS